MSENQEFTEEQIQVIKDRLKEKIAVNRRMKRDAARQERSNMVRQYIPANWTVDALGMQHYHSEKVIWHKKASNMPNQYLRMDRIGKTRMPQWLTKKHR